MENVLQLPVIRREGIGKLAAALKLRMLVGFCGRMLLTTIQSAHNVYGCQPASKHPSSLLHNRSSRMGKTRSWV